MGLLMGDATFTKITIYFVLKMTSSKHSHIFTVLVNILYF